MNKPRCTVFCSILFHSIPVVAAPKITSQQFLSILGWSGSTIVLGNVQCWGMSYYLEKVGQGPTVLSVGAIVCVCGVVVVGGGLDNFLSFIISLLVPALWKTARYRLKCCLKRPIYPKQTTNQPFSPYHEISCPS